MGKPILSICYPTYNRCKTLDETVRSVLKYSGDDIEIVILDNCSTDSTKSVVQSIKDERVRYYRNKTNTGFTNLLLVLLKAKAEYALLMSDEDVADPDCIKPIMAMLREHPEVGVFSLSVDIFHKPYFSFKDEKIDPGVKAILKMHEHAYMSGMVFKTAIIKKAIESLTPRDIWIKYGKSNYPHIALAMQLCSEHPLYTSDMIITDHEKEAERDAHANSYVEKRKAKKPASVRSAYDPSMRLRQCLEIHKILADLKLDGDGKHYVTKQLGVRCGKSGSIGYLKSLLDGGVKAILREKYSSYEPEKRSYLAYNLKVRRCLLRQGLRMGMFTVKDVLAYPFIHCIRLVKDCLLFLAGCIEYAVLSFKYKNERKD